MTYTVSGGKLNLTHLLNHFYIYLKCYSNVKVPPFTHITASVPSGI